MGIENVQIPEAEQIRRPVSSDEQQVKRFTEGLSPEEQKKLDRVDRALNLGSGIIKKWLKEKKGIEFTVEQEAEFDHMYQASFAFSSLIM